MSPDWQGGFYLLVLEADNSQIACVNELRSLYRPRAHTEKDGSNFQIFVNADKFSVKKTKTKKQQQHRYLEIEFKQLELENVGGEKGAAAALHLGLQRFLKTCE